MSWWQALHLALSAALFVLVFIECDDEPFWGRFASAACVALFWLPLAILTAIWLAVDWVGDRLKARRK